jgi:hypothetical protein
MSAPCFTTWAQPPYASPDERFEVDGANAAASFLRGHRIGERDIEDVWDAIALHTTPGIPKHKRPVVALVTAGVEMDVLGLEYDAFTPEQREEVCACHPRGHGFKNGIIDASQGERSRSRKLPSVTSRPTCSNYGTRNTNASISAKSS